MHAHLLPAMHAPQVLEANALATASPSGTTGQGGAQQGASHSGAGDPGAGHKPGGCRGKDLGNILRRYIGAQVTGYTG